jgi:redox-sensitive bicupin YhaK (pirin superfamily)
MGTVRRIEKVIKGKPTIEGAGVHLKRAFGNNEVPLFDPFLMLDDFHSENPADYLKGFPWHPHRGIETITYVLHGEVDHGDSMGNKGIIHSGDVQWMTAGSGIIHQEMPKGQKGGLMWGFQLWANLPARHKMMAPRYRDVKSSQIPQLITGDGASVKIICGQVDDTRGPVQDIVIAPEYLDITVPPKSQFKHTTDRGRTVLAYVIEGTGYFDVNRESLLGPEHLVAFADGDEILVSTQEKSVRFLLISGKPIKEPVAWYGPIVMNTKEELKIAFEEYQNGTFLKHTQ